MAQEDGSDHGHILDTASYHYEILKMDSDEPADDGEVGRIVITDLFSYAFPIIRYDNGDLAIRETLSDGHVYLKEVFGKKRDLLYTTDGRIVAPTLISFKDHDAFKDYDDIKQYQIVQHDYTHFTWRLNTNNHTHEEAIINEFKKVFGEDAKFEFEYVDEIPTLASGKMQMTICEIEGVDGATCGVH